MDIDDAHPAASMRTHTVTCGTSSFKVLTEVFADRVLVVVTPSGRVGCWLLGTTLAVESGRPTYDVRPLLGYRQDDAWIGTVARQLLEDMRRKNCLKSLLLGITIGAECQNSDNVRHLVRELSGLGAW
ncbi:hypothetical protein FVE85_6629 [Porphyridium purpureum]|uniref:Uncharacterized protein n=1 Tax=Porphyridium purpureum TaxID=35688 RepID=A0A5J4Z7Q9_PORPP|nr:hypothetical protein FVE85_6629 [Porphyridium purpureum]|eukprot:POR0639..scf295_1